MAVKYHEHCVFGHRDTQYLVSDWQEFKQVFVAAVWGSLGALVCGASGNLAASVLCGGVFAMAGWFISESFYNLDRWYSADCGGGDGINIDFDYVGTVTHTWGRSWAGYHYSHTTHLSYAHNLHKHCNKYSG